MAGQIMPEQMTELAAAGVRRVVNNRPDGEEPGQPSGPEVEAAARAAGLDYLHLPVVGGFTEDAVERMAEATDTPGVTLAFCKSGTRSTLLWALARAQAGDDPQELDAKAAAAGYDLGPVRRFLQSH